MKKLIAICVTVIMLFSLTSCQWLDAFLIGWGEGTVQTFTVQEMNITLKGEFTREEEVKEENGAAVFTSTYSVVRVERFSYEALGYAQDPQLDAVGVANAYVSSWNFTPTIYNEDGLVYVIYQREGIDGIYESYFFVSKNAYWCVEMFCWSGDYEQLCSSFTEWAGSVTFSDSTESANF